MPASSSKIGVLVAQLGTPQAPTARALRPYLRQFLSDPRVIDLHPLRWYPILYLFVLTRRPARSAALYANIWTDEGSPLMVHSQAQTRGLARAVGARRIESCSACATASRASSAPYQSLESGKASSASSSFPCFRSFPAPPPARSTTRSTARPWAGAALGFSPANARCQRCASSLPTQITPRTSTRSNSRSPQQSPASVGRPDRYLITFHGIPQRYVDEGDPYRRQCEETARQLAAALGLADDEWVSGFQSRFGKEPWLEPYTEEVLAHLGGQGVRRLVAICPGFTADCLETLDEIGREGAEQFAHGGGQQFHLAPCLNDHPVWLDAMAAIARQELAGWDA